MNFLTAQTTFINLVNSLECNDRLRFISWCKDDFLKDAAYGQCYFDLRTIAEDIKTIVPFNAILPSEQVNHSMLGKLSPNESNAPILHVDSFLYEDEQIDGLVNEGKLSRNFCKSCGSVDTAPITFISHSASIESMEVIFKYVLPDLSSKVVLDVGSRLGAVLYGAYYYSSAKKIIGVEMNPDLCKLQKHIVDKYSLKDRIEVICGDICQLPPVIQVADVIIFNNVFECYIPKEGQEQIWKWLRSNIIKPGTLLVTIPSIEETLSSLETGIDVSSWLRKIPIVDPIALSKMEDQDLESDLCTYVVI